MLEESDWIAQFAGSVNPDAARNGEPRVLLVEILSQDPNAVKLKP